MGKRIDKYGLKIEENLFNFINNEVLDNLNFEKESFWKNFSNFITDYAPINNSLLKKRLDLKVKIDEWHKKNKAKEINLKNINSF